MRKFLFILCFCILLVTGKAVAAENITLSLPASVIGEAVTALLPLDVNATSKALQGQITVISIKNLQMLDNQVKARLHLSGKNMELVTDVAGHQIRLKVGSVDIDFNVLAQVRFDAAKQVLYIKPIIDEVQSAEDAASGDAGHALVALLNGQEFPLTLQKIDPIVAKAGTKTLTIANQITDIRARKDGLLFSLAPRISSTKPPEAR